MTSHRTNFSRRGFLIGSVATALCMQASIAAQTPVPGGTSPFADRIGELFAMAPTTEFSPEIPLPFYYADLQKQMDAIGVEHLDPAVESDEVPEGYVRASLALPLAAHAFQMGMEEEWFDTFGFAPFGVDRALTINNPPSVVSIFTGGIDGATVEAALEASGFSQVLQETGGSYWTVGDELNLESMVGRLGVGMMNHAAIYDGAVVFAQRESDLQQVTQTVAGLAPSMLEQETWPGMTNVFSPDTVGLTPISPAAVAAQGALPADGVATPALDDSVAMQYLAFGVRAGAMSYPLSLVGEGTPESVEESAFDNVPAQVEVRIRYQEEAMARQEAEAIPDRWMEMLSVLSERTYADLMELEDARVHEQDPLVVAVDFRSPVTNRWIQMVQWLDVAPFMPVRG